MRLINADALIERIREEKIASGMAKARLMEMVKEAPTIGGWISVKDELPEENKEVLAYTGAYMFIAAYTTNPIKYWYTIGGSAMRTVIYWMPLPSTEGLNEA